MDRKQLMRRLAQTEARIEWGYGRLDRQVDLVNRLEDLQLPASAARRLLRVLVGLQALNLRDRDRLGAELAECDAREASRVRRLLGLAEGDGAVASPSIPPKRSPPPGEIRAGFWGADSREVS